MDRRGRRGPRLVRGVRRRRTRHAAHRAGRGGPLGHRGPGGTARLAAGGVRPGHRGRPERRRPGTVRPLVALLQRHRPGPGRGVRVRLVGVPPHPRRDEAGGGEDPARREDAVGGAGPPGRARPAHRGRGRGPRLVAGPDGPGDRGPGRHALRTRRAGAEGGVAHRPARRRGGPLLHGPVGGLLPARPHLAAHHGADPLPGLRPRLDLVPRGRARPPPPARAVGARGREPLPLPGDGRHRQRQRRGLGAVRGAADGRAGLPHRPGGAPRLPGRADDAGGPGDRGHRHAPGAGDPRRLAVPPRRALDAGAGAGVLRQAQQPPRGLRGERADPVPDDPRPGDRLQARRAGLAAGPGAGAAAARGGVRPEVLAHGGPLPGLPRPGRPGGRAVRTLSRSRLRSLDRRARRAAPPVPLPCWRAGDDRRPGTPRRPRGACTGPWPPEGRSVDEARRRSQQVSGVRAVRVPRARRLRHARRGVAGLRPATRPRAA
ncbi:hypothetical protein SGPA1_20617 [Streptomyces misionensis JCM 4497]